MKAFPRPVRDRQFLAKISRQAHATNQIFRSFDIFCIFTHLPHQSCTTDAFAIRPLARDIAPLSRHSWEQHYQHSDTQPLSTTTSCA